MNTEQDSKSPAILPLPPAPGSADSSSRPEVPARSGSLDPLFEVFREIQDCVKNMPCGGIGKDGPTQEELDAASQDGHPVDGDSMYHQGQQAWLIAQRGLDILSNARISDESPRQKL